MKRALYRVQYPILAIAILALFFLSSRRHENVFWISLAVAVAIYYVVTNFYFYWALPRRSRDIPSLAVCFLGALLVALATGDREGDANAVTVVAAAAGAFAFLFTAVKTGVPAHVGILVNTESVSAHWNDGVPDVARGNLVAERMRELHLFHKPEFVDGRFGVWPEHFEISQEGSVVWYVKGLPGTRVTIRFDQGYDPFSQPGGAPSQFVALVPDIGLGMTAAGPAIQPGRGVYSVIVERPGAPPVPFVVEGGGSQTKG